MLLFYFSMPKNVKMSSIRLFVQCAKNTTSKKESFNILLLFLRSMITKVIDVISGVGQCVCVCVCNIYKTII